MSELKPCPFCGAKPEIVTRDVEPQGDSWYGKKCETFVLCDCGACLFDGAFHEGFYDAENRAVAAWNCRATNAAPAEGRKLPPILGVSRVADNPRAVLLILRHEPTDDDLRSIHFALATTPPTSEADKKDASRWRMAVKHHVVPKYVDGETCEDYIDAEIDRAAAKEQL